MNLERENKIEILERIVQLDYFNSILVHDKYILTVEQRLCYPSYKNGKDIFVRNKLLGWDISLFHFYASSDEAPVEYLFSKQIHFREKTVDRNIVSGTWNKVFIYFKDLNHVVN